MDEKLKSEFTIKSVRLPLTGKENIQVREGYI